MRRAASRIAMISAWAVGSCAPIGWLYPLPAGHVEELERRRPILTAEKHAAGTRRVAALLEQLFELAVTRLPIGRVFRGVEHLGDRHLRGPIPHADAVAAPCSVVVVLD